MARDDDAKLRAQAAERGYRLEPLPIRRCWQLIDERTGEAARRPDGATAFNVVQGLSFFRSIKRPGGARAPDA